MAKGDSSLHIVSPTLPHLARVALNLLQKMPCAIHVIGDPVEKADAFKSMDFAVATSGTVGLELAVADVPHIIGYKLSAMTARMIRNKIRTKYAHLANILLEQEAVPEFLQEKCVPPNLVASLRTLKNDRMATMRQRQAFERARSMIRGAKAGSPSVQAAEFILALARGQ
jgi:lipid-A-disaccharide synthase